MVLRTTASYSSLQEVIVLGQAAVRASSSPDRATMESVTNTKVTIKLSFEKKNCFGLVSPKHGHPSPLNELSEEVLFQPWKENSAERSPFCSCFCSPYPFLPLRSAHWRLLLLPGCDRKLNQTFKLDSSTLFQIVISGSGGQDKLKLTLPQLTAPQPSEHCTRSSNPTNGCSFEEGFYCYTGANTCSLG